MHEASNYKSILSPFIDGLLSEKRSLGFDYRTEELILIRFDRYCIDVGLNTLNVTRDFLDGWCMQSDTEGLSNQRKRITAVRQLMLYMISLGINVYLPKGNGRKEVVLPHIFTQEELFSFFHEVDSYEPLSCQPVYRRLAKEYRVLFRLLYCCGLRNTEGAGIATEQVDLINGILTILDSKGNKDRLVYMADDVVEVCKEYFEFLCDDLSGIPKWFFPAKMVKTTKVL